MSESTVEVSTEALAALTNRVTEEVRYQMPEGTADQIASVASTVVMAVLDRVSETGTDVNADEALEEAGKSLPKRPAVPSDMAVTRLAVAMEGMSPADLDSLADEVVGRIMSENPGLSHNAVQAAAGRAMVAALAQRV
jgi:hypothetical protein